MTSLALAPYRSNRRKRLTRGSLVAALDVGSHKICCLIARVGEDDGFTVVGMSHQSAAGMRCGTIADFDSAASAIGAAVQAAERMAGESIDGVYAAISGVHTHSRHLNLEVDIAGQRVLDGDLAFALAHARRLERPGEAELIHAIPASYAIDDQKGILDPRGMFGDTLKIDVHSVVARAAPVRNLTSAIGANHLSVHGLAHAAYAAGLAVLVEDELELGCTLVDIGGGTAEIAVFGGGNLVHVDSVPIGGQHVTNDIARGLTTPLAHAERIKTLHGSALAGAADAHDYIDVPQLGEGEEGGTSTVPRSLLVGFIRPRLEEMFELIRARLDANGFAKEAGRQLVLTGGGCQIPGTRELAHLILDKQVRIGRPTKLAGLADAVSGPAFATAAGLIAFAERQEAAPEPLPAMPGPHVHSLWGRVGSWLRENF